MFVGLVRDPGWHGPPDGLPEQPDREPRAWRIPWSLIAWVIALGALIALVPVVDHEIGNFAGYVLILVVIALGTSRVERWCSRQYWRGLRDYTMRVRERVADGKPYGIGLRLSARAAQELAQQSETLRTEVDRFLSQIRAA